MNNELVNALNAKKQDSLRKDKELRQLHATQKANGVAAVELNKIVKAIKEVQADYYKADKDLKDYTEAYNSYVAAVGTDEEAAKKAELKAMEETLASAYGITLLEEIPELEEEEPEVEEPEVEDPEEEEEEEVENVVAPKPSLAGKIAKWTLLTAGAIGLVGTAVHTGMLLARDEVVDQNEDEDLEPGAYGTFTDATDQEQVEARAQYLYDNYFGDFASQLSPSEQAAITPEKIANTIRVLNGELPLDADGNRYYDANLVDDFGQAFVYMVADLPSSPNIDKVYHVPSHLFAVDGSATSEFMKAYDQDYAAIAEGRNTRDGEKTRAAIASLGEKMWNEWVLQGMHEGNSPYNLPASQRNLAFLGTMAPYATYAFEYNLNAMQPVCITGCVDYSTKLMQEMTVNEIYVGYTTGKWDTVLAKAAGISNTENPDSIAFHQDLTDQLQYQASQIQTKKLN